MTVGLLLDRLERFRRGICIYRDIYTANVRHPHSGSEGMHSSDLEAFRDKLRQEFGLLDEYVTAFSQGRYHIHLDSRGQQDIYIHALSEECQERHLVSILEDLDHMVAELQERPLHQHLTLHHPLKKRLGDHPHCSVGSLGHLGFSSTPGTPENLHAVFRLITRVIHQQITHPDEKEKLQTHLRAIIHHPEMTELLSLSPSKL